VKKNKMKPILLSGHTRSLTKVKYNSHGDLLFSVSKDNQPSVWFSENGERLGTFVGHSGTVWDVDVSFDSNQIFTGSADNSCRLWNVSNGKCIYKWDTKTAVRVVGIAMGDHLGFYITDATMGYLSKIHIISLTDHSQDPIQVISIPGSKATTGSWVGLNKMIYTGHEDGSVSVWDVEVFFN
jgi:translation initiation factor 3 subunit I